VLLVVACSGSGTDDPQRTSGTDQDTEITVAAGGEATPGGVLQVGLGSETTGWDPSSAQWAGSGYNVANAIFDRLMAYDEQGNPVPYLAESMTPNEDFTLWTISLRDGVTFHDGSPFDADALKLNIETHLASAITGPTLDAIETIRVVDPTTVEVVMSSPWSTFPHLLTAQPGYMMAPAMIEDPQGTNNPIGTGPFVFEEWIQDNHLTTTKNEDYWRDGFPLLDGIEFQILADTTARTSSLQNGEVDVIEVSEPGQIISVTEQGDAGEMQVFIDAEGESNETFVALNMSKPPFDDPVARQAVAYAIDRDILSQSVYQGLFEPAYGMFKEDSPWYTPTDFPRFDPDRARELVAQYEADNGEPLSFSVNITGQPEIQAIAQLAQAQMEEVGIEVELNVLEQTQLILEALGGTYEATGFYLFGSPHPDREYVFLHEDNATGSIALAFSRNQNSRLSLNPPAGMLVVAS
jgi:ABC-type transport system substrate-binding protein